MIVNEEDKLKTKESSVRNGPWVKNQRENRNTRKRRIYQFTQKAYEQNKKATINKLLSGNLILGSKKQVFSDIEDVEKVYEK